LRIYPPSRSQAKAALKHANRPRLRFRDPDAKARSDAEAAAEQEAATQLGQYARRIAPMATAHWSQQSIDLAQVLCFIEKLVNELYH